MNTTIRKILVSLFIASFVLSMGACRTMRGLGEDTEKAGEKIQKEADQHIDEKNSRRP